MITKICTKCKKLLPTNLFYKAPHNGKYVTKCKKCTATQRYKQALNNPERAKRVQQTKNIKRYFCGRLKIKRQNIPSQLIGLKRVSILIQRNIATLKKEIKILKKDIKQIKSISEFKICSRAKYRRKWRANNPEKSDIIQLRKNIARSTGLKKEDIPIDIIQLKRTMLLIKRELRKGGENNDNIREITARA